MRNKNIDELIEDFQQLQAQQSLVLEKITEARENEKEGSNIKSPKDPGTFATAKPKDKDKSADWYHQPTDREFVPKDRVYIKK